MTDDSVMAPNVQGPGESKPAPERPGGTVETPDDLAAPEEVKAAKVATKKAAKKREARAEKPAAAPSVEATDASSGAKWSIWDKFPGTGELANVRAATDYLNTMVSAALVAHGFGERMARLGVDGNWWSENQEALVAFQQARGQSETGFVGPETWEALGLSGSPEGLARIFELDGVDELEAGDQSDLAFLVQSLLILNGYGEQLKYTATRNWTAGSTLALNQARADYREQ